MPKLFEETLESEEGMLEVRGDSFFREETERDQICSFTEKESDEEESEDAAALRITKAMMAILNS